MPRHIYVVRVGEVEKVMDCIPPLITVYKKGEVLNKVSQCFLAFTGEKTLWSGGNSATENKLTCGKCFNFLLHKVS